MLFQVAFVLFCIGFVAFIASLTVSAIGYKGVLVQLPDAEDLRIVQLWREREVKREQTAVLQELRDVELFIIRMLESGVYTVHEILGATSDIAVSLKPYFQRCYNRYFTEGLSAIDKMELELPDESFIILCEALKSAAVVGRKQMARGIADQLSEIKQIAIFKRDEQIAKKETQFMLALMLPVAAVFIIQVYPWIVQVMQNLNVFG